MKDDFNMPQYLDRVKPSKRYYGTISKKGREWVIEAEPQVLELVRRVFHATDQDEKGFAIIPATKRLVGDLNWFMMRYPLKIKSFEDWNKDISEAKEYVRTRAVINSQTERISLPSQFRGKLFDFQEKGVSFMFNNKKCLLADEMGLGKTVEALAMLSKINQYPVLIVVPPHLLGQWESEIKRFLGEEIKIHIIKGLTPYTLPDANIYLIHYLLFRGWGKDLSFAGFNNIIFDEIQELRHCNSDKYNSVKSLIKNSNPEYVLGLSGTPIYNYGYEMYNVMDVIEENCLGNREYFLREWCRGWDTKVVDKPELLGKWLSEEGLMMRRRKEDVLKELPPKRRTIQKILFNDKLYIELSSKAIQIAKEIPFAPSKIVGSLLMNIVMGMRRASGVSKAQYVAEFVKLLLDSQEPCILYGFHHIVIDLYKEFLKDYNPLCVSGRENRIEKEENIKKFMAGETNLLIINLRTTAGLNLQRARCVVFGELDWSPAIHTQAEDRVHRIGQNDSVMCYYCIAPTTSDEEISQCLDLKRWQFEGIMQDKTEDEKQKMMSQIDAQKFMWNIVDKLNKSEE